MRKYKYWVLAGILVLLTAIIWILWFVNREVATDVRITVNGQEYKTVSIDKNQTIVIEQDGQENTIEVHDGVVRMTHASCPDQICVHQGSIHQAPESIVCLPNRVYVELISNDEEGVIYDGIAQ